MKKLTVGKIVFIVVILVILYTFFNSIVGDSILKSNGKCTKAILYRETYGGKTKPSLGYKFLIDGKEYDGLVVEDKVLKIGDSICVVYIESFPRINGPLAYFDRGEIKCDCNK